MKGKIQPERSWTWLMYSRRSWAGYRKRTYRFLLEARAKDAKLQSLHEVGPHGIRDPTLQFSIVFRLRSLKQILLRMSNFLFCNGYKRDLKEG